MSFPPPSPAQPPQTPATQDAEGSNVRGLNLLKHQAGIWTILSPPPRAGFCHFIGEDWDSIAIFLKSYLFMH